jgi:cell division protein FtsA
VSKPDPVAALEIGTSRTVLAIGEPLAPGRVKVLAVEEIPSRGVRKSQIVDIAQAGLSIASVLQRAEDKTRYTIHQTNLAATGPHVRSKLYTTQWQLNGPEVTDEDIAGVYNLSIDAGVDSAERAILDASEMGYGLDDLDGIPQPKGMTGRILRLNTLFVHGSAQRMEDARKAAQYKAKLEIADVFFSSSRAAAAVLTPEARRDGALVIDLGGGTTGYTVWADGHLVHADVLGVGGDHVTNDVSLAFGITRSQAEQAKKEAQAVVGDNGGTPRIELPSTTPGFGPVSISRRALDTVVNARLHETFAIIRTELDRADLLHRIHSGVVLVGGGSAQPGIARLAGNVFGLAARIGELVPGVEGLEDVENPAAYAAAAGVLLASQPDPESDSLVKRFFGGFFGK